MDLGWPPLYFYLPPDYWPHPLPDSADSPWLGFGVGIYAWTVQTCLRLKAAGISCELTSNFPQDGVVFVHRNILANKQIRPDCRLNLILVCLKGELLPFRAALLHIVQNPLEASRSSYFIPHWPQPGLVPRHAGRGACLENVAFMGHRDNLAPELATPAWEQALADLGLVWQPRLSHHHWSRLEGMHPQWHDYSEVDVVVAVRSFRHQNRQRRQNYRNKPATKLYNTWLAGVPAILGQESAFQAERRSPLDYLEVQSPEEVLQALKRLQQQPDLHQAMAERSRLRAAEVAPAAITQRWIAFLKEVAVPTYHRWCQLPLSRRRALLAQQAFTASKARAECKLRSLLGSGLESLRLPK